MKLKYIIALCITGLMVYCLAITHYGTILTLKYPIDDCPRVTQSSRLPELISKLGGAWA